MAKPSSKRSSRLSRSKRFERFELCLPGAMGFVKRSTHPTYDSQRAKAAGRVKIETRK